MTDVELEVKVIESPHEMYRWARAMRNNGLTIGFVATMGALHTGHLSLIDRARSECDRVVVSIFVNPNQFGPGEDFSSYPRPFDDDLKLCDEAKVDIVFHPTAQAMYESNETSAISLGGLDARLEGASRPEHFVGVATIVAKLLAIVKPHRTYWGKKDAQQCAVIRHLVRELNLDVETIFCPVMRESDGLALSSRNIYLSLDERTAALHISAALRAASSSFSTGEHQASALLSTVEKELTISPLIAVDYVAIVDPDTFLSVTDVKVGSQLVIAVRVGSTRLIDMVEFV